MGRYYDGGVLIYPSGWDTWNEDVAVPYYEDFKADMLITLKENWVFQHLFRFAINWVPHAIIDHSPVSEAITGRLGTAFRVIAISRHGQRELRRNGIESTYIPHGCRTDIFKPLDRDFCRKLFFLEPDEFVVGIVALNRARKMIAHQLRGYKLFMERNPDIKGHLFLWTDVRAAQQPELEPGVSDVSVSLLPEIMELGLGEAVRWPEDRVIREGIPDDAGEKYPNEWDMVKLFNTFDVLLLCTGGEGFGNPLVEAQACGKAVITTEYAAGPEQVGAGLTVPYSDYVILNTPGTRYALCDLDKMADALAKIANADPEKLAKRARSFAERYDWDTIMSRYWEPFLSECEEELRPLVTKEGVKKW